MSLDETIEELIFLSKYFGQSTLNIQGAGGNISIKHEDLLIIKSSGFIMGNMEKDKGYCITKGLEKIKGDGRPSMEISFHLLLKKYTIHLHFIPSNIILCKEYKEDNFKNFGINHIILDYFPPGEILSNEIKKNKDKDIIFLKNHGLIISCDNFSEIFLKFNYLLEYFEIKDDTFEINYKLYEKYKVSTIVKELDFPLDYILEIKYCFPDLAVYVQKIVKEDIEMTDLLIYKNKLFVISKTIEKSYALIEILESYKLLCLNYKDLKIIDSNFIINMEQEKYRK